MATTRDSHAARHPAGTTSGGQFAAIGHAEAEVRLTGDVATYLPSDLTAAPGSFPRCPTCSGSGVVSDSACPVCAGTGSLADDDAWHRQSEMDERCTFACPDCDGTLYVMAAGGGLEVCRACDGIGVITDYSLAVD